MSELVSVRFLNRVSPYQPGDQASFPAGRARELVNVGAAEYADTEHPAEEAPTIKPPRPRPQVKPNAKAETKADTKPDADK